MTAAELREELIPHLAKPAAKPRPDAKLLLAGKLENGRDWRIVRLSYADTGVVEDVVEIVDDLALLGEPCWRKVEGKDAISVYVRVQRALVDALTKDME